MKHSQLHYTTVQVLSMTNQLQFTSLADFITYIEHYSLYQIFCIIDAKNTLPKHFAVMHNNVLLRHSAMGFATLDDFSKASANAFPNAETYYKALEQGYKTFNDYEIANQAGITEKAILDTVKNTGFVQGFEEFTEQLAQYANEIQATFTEVTDAYKLYQYAINNGFDNYYQFKTALDKGFTSKDLYDVATEHEFPDNATYTEALQRGFRTYSELLIANAAKVRDSVDMFKLMQLRHVGEETNTYDERLLMVILSKIEQGKRISTNKLFDFFTKTINEYQYEDTKTIPEWFAQQFSSKEAFSHYISTTNQLKKYGDYDHDGEFFQINQMQDRAVVLDGSNVAHNSNGYANSMPLVSNLVAMVDFLKRKGFSEIIIIVDASLKKKLKDPEKLAELMATTEYLVAPVENPADLFIIEYVKAKHCLLVSNDAFREWKYKDPWVAENIDYYRLSFIIKSNEIIMPDLK
ncbi:MAG: hypothetical protein QM541_00655 [Flavobacterium sp.]|nr:hypothetical protein [Flavobacterium sp.]